MRRPPSKRALDYPTCEEEKTLKMLHTVAEVFRFCVDGKDKCKLPWISLLL